MRKLILFVLRHFCTFIAKISVGSYGSNFAVNRFSRFSKNTSVMNHCNFNGIKIQGMGKVSIGNHFHSGQKVWFITDSHNYEGNKIPYDDTMIIKDIKIDDFVWLGSNVMVLGGVHIGEGAIVQAGSVVCSDIEPYSIVGGAPARVFKMRNVNHFITLKNLGLTN